MSERALVPAVLLHVPYVRRAGAWPFGEHQLHRHAAEVLVPLLMAWRHCRVPIRISVALSPVLAAQLADREILRGIGQWIRRRWEAVRELPSGLPAELERAWHWERERTGEVEEAWFGSLGQQPLAALAALQADGLVEILATPATGAILPLAPRPSAVRMQLQVARATLDDLMGAAPEGLWTPEGAWASAARGGWSLDALAAEVGFRYVLDSARGWVDQDDGIGSREPFGPAVSPEGLVHLAPPDSFMAACLDPLSGFPGEGGYLDTLPDGFFSVAPAGPLLARGGADEGESGGTGQPYLPEQARDLADRHAASALALARQFLDTATDRASGRASLLLPVDAERFLAWPEGKRWLQQLLERAPEAGLTLRSAGEIAAWSPCRPLSAVLPSSWDRSGTLQPWQPLNSDWYWQQVAGTADHAESLVGHRGGDGRPLMMRALAQAQREALLLASGDWPRMVGAGGGSADYAAARIRDHLDRFRRLADMVDAGEPDESLVERYEALDNAFVRLDPAWAYPAAEPAWSPDDD
ncbi:MAG: 1,4-alpha-glucan branching protein domain-containing protein [Candidatus Sericytochromatia bacterium]|nr:1,4-alpha-glucan branching protein domain-containing protein [Candidatus Sericytochromatia bacterium]